jgi:predicted GIY-YIG superfamily endonuclease
MSEVGGRTIYLLHFERPFGHARHYLGSAEDLEARLTEHAADAGAPEPGEGRR